MKLLSSLDKIILFSLNKSKSPISYTRLARLIYISDLHNQLLNSEALPITWVKFGKETKSEDISNSLDKLVSYNLVKFRLTNRRKYYSISTSFSVGVDTNISYALSSYFQSKYINCHPKKLDECENSLIYKLNKNTPTT